MNENQNFTTGPIYAPLIRFCLPVLLALFLQAMYSAVDLMIVGQFGGDLADVYVSAVSTGSQIMISLTFVVTGLAMGLTVLVGEKIGAGRREEAGRIIGSDRMANSALRIQATCMATGQAAGVLAALSDQYHGNISNIPMEKVRQILQEHGAIVPQNSLQ